jgi:glycosyltransferase
MKVTIVTVSFNSARTIADTLRSVAGQAYGDIEHIVIDGGSRDATASIVRQHGQRVSRFVSEPDKGIYDAMNKGLAFATGEFIGYLNADDTYAGDSVVSRVAEAAARAPVDAIFGDLVYVDEKEGERVIRRWRAGAFSMGRLRRGWMPPHPTLFVRTALLREIGGFNTGFRVAADYDCVLRLFARNGLRVAYIEKELVRMRLGGVSNGSIAGVWRKSREDLHALRSNGVGGIYTLMCKNIRKVGQIQWSALRVRV